MTKRWTGPRKENRIRHPAGPVILASPGQLHPFKTTGVYVAYVRRAVHDDGKTNSKLPNSASPRC
ncbi:MAG: hypothetical protein C6W57_16940 [Caldibacillus debilis]|nr:MAG: hypothetical protein C6W57_16940 [Caldibacillus debilis]